MVRQEGLAVAAAIVSGATGRDAHAPLEGSAPDPSGSAITSIGDTVPVRERALGRDDIALLG